ncbi:MAG: TRAP transporter substrate-binding protein DctP [Oscillospiraceae bacterium]|nr:TRAP transporter substrate-binding protein DctP [Oscillospiraceae bacterium]
MKKFTKLAALILALAMVFSLAACGGSSSNAGTTTTPSNSTNASSGAMSTVGSAAATTDDGSDNLPTVTWKMGSTWGSGNVHFTVDNRFTELVSQLTGGKFQITNYAEGELCSASQLFDYVQEGTIQCGGDWAGYWAGKDTAFELLSTTLSLFSGLDYYLWFNQADGVEVAQNLYGQYNMTWFPIVCHMSESGIRSNSPITSIADMQKLKIRLGGVIAGKVGQKLGINITTVSGSELYEALMRGVIDAGEFSGPNADASLKLDEVTTYWCEPCWYQSSGNNGVMINQDAWNELPTEYQDAIKLASTTCLNESFARYTWLDCNAANKMLDDGITVTQMNDADFDTIEKTIAEVYTAECASNANFKTVFDSMMSYRDVVDPYREMLGYGGFGWGSTWVNEYYK